MLGINVSSSALVRMIRSLGLGGSTWEVLFGPASPKNMRGLRNCFGPTCFSEAKWKGFVGNSFFFQVQGISSIEEGTPR